MRIRKNKNRIKSLREKLLTVFIIYGAVLLVILWGLQSVWMEKYYENSMTRKCKTGLTIISTLYESNNDIGYEEFCESIVNAASRNDLFIYMETCDGLFSISSDDLATAGRSIPGIRNVISDARKMLLNSQQDEISFTSFGNNEEKIIVWAKNAGGHLREPVRIYVAAFLAPLGPAVSIMRTQLLFVSIAVLILGSIIAYITSVRLARPMTEMGLEAKKLGEGNFDVDFKGDDYLEINDLADALNDASAQLKVSDTLRKDLLANVSHDLRTPLTMIKSYAEMIRDLSGDVKEKREEHLSVIIDETDRLSDLVNDILKLSRLQAGTEEFEEKEFDLQKAADDIYQTFRIFESEGYSISFEPLNEPVSVIGDEGKIKQVISNMVSNAVKYSEDHKEIRIHFEKDEGYIKLIVSDKGIGISEDQLSMIWNRYQRASQRGSRSKEGSGLGLSICSEILKYHGADYGVESVPGEGSDFWFRMKIFG